MPGSDGATSGFDPRFDPQFQPGYRPGGGAAPGRPPVRPAPGIEVRPLRDVGAAAVGSVPSPLRAPEDVGYHEPPADDARYDDDGEGALAASPRDNPFMLTLWAIGAAFIIGGLVIFAFLRSLNESLASGSSTPFDYFMLQSMTPLAPQMTLFGAAVIVALLFLLAMRRDREMRERASSGHAARAQHPTSGAQSDTRPGRDSPQV